MPAVDELSVADWHRLNGLLERALELEPEQRTAWLRALPATEADLLPLLQRLLSPKELTETARFAVPPPAHAVVDDREISGERAGQFLGPYRLVRELGQGGMGTVWLAERADGAFERQVALKLPRAEWTDRGLAQRFARERAVLASLNHPNIAQLFDAGWSESGRPYLALEYVDGRPLHGWCEAQRLDLTGRLALFVEVVRAVAHAHARLIVHRDLKPSNVLVTGAGQVKLLDFGIAKLLAAETASAEETELTRLAGRALTPQYAAPEQVLGQPVSTATDIYALGVLLFELLTGERPYRLGREALQWRAVLEEAIVRRDAPAPSAVVKDKGRRRALRGDLDAIVLKALKKAPEQRYETAAAFADDIERYLGRLPVRAQRDRAAYRFSRFLVRNRLAVGAVGAVMVALTAGMTVALWQARVARGEAARANTIKEFVLSIIQQADPVASRQTKEADIALLTAAESRVDKELEGQPELALQMRRTIGAAYRNRGEYKRASQVLRKGIEQARTVLPPDNLELLAAFVQIAEEFVIDSRRAWTDIEAAIQVLRRLGPRAQPLLADALLARHRAVRWSVTGVQLYENVWEARRAALATGDAGRILEAASEIVETLTPHGRGAESLPVIAEAREFAARDGRMDPADPRWITAMAYHGLALCWSGKATEGLELARNAVAESKARHGANSLVSEVALGVLATTYRCAGDPKGALNPMREAYAISIKRDPPGSVNRELRIVWLVELLFALEQHDEIRRVLHDTPVVRELTPGSPALSPTSTPIHVRAWEAEVRFRLGEYEAAERAAEEAVPMMEAEGALVEADRLFDVLARALLENGKTQRAESFAAAALEGEGKGDMLPSANRRASRSLLLAEVRLALGKYQSALELAEQALRFFSEKAPPREAARAQVNLRLGRALLGLGRRQEAVEALSLALAHWHKVDPSSMATALASFWYGQGLIASGDVQGGRALLDAARPKLAAAPSPRIRALVASGEDRSLSATVEGR